MDSLQWQRGKNLKRAIEETGRAPTIQDYAVALILLANEKHITLEQIVQALIVANEFDATIKRPTAGTISELGY